MVYLIVIVMQLNTIMLVLLGDFSGTESSNEANCHRSAMRVLNIRHVWCPVSNYGKFIFPHLGSEKNLKKK